MNDVARKQDQARAGFDVVERYRAKIAGVIAVVAVVAYDEDVVLRHFVRCVVVPGDESGRQDARIGVFDTFGIFERLTVDEDHLVPDLDRLALCRNTSFEEVFALIFRRFDDHEVARRWIAETGHPEGRDFGFEEGQPIRYLCSVRDLVSDDEVTRQDCVFHRSGCDVVGLHDRRPDQNGCSDDEDGTFQEFFQRAALGRLFAFHPGSDL